MRANKKIMGALSFLLMAVFLAASGACAGQGTASDKEQKEDAAGFKEFTDHVQEYVKLHKAVEANLPVLKPTDLPEMITAHQQALARKIREARPRAVVAALLQRAEACSSGIDQGPQTSDHH